MTRQQITDQTEFAALMVGEFPAADINDINELMRLARRHGKLQEKACNEQVPENHDAKCEDEIWRVCCRIGCKVKFGGDPRGYTVKVFLPSGRYNTWGGAEDGWGVPQ